MKKTGINGASFLFGVSISLFFILFYSHHLNYQEQYQMFLFTKSYLMPYLGKPGGLSDYIGNFLTQFYFYSWVGALIIGLIMIILQRGIWQISKLSGADSVAYPLSFIPPILYTGLLCDENYLLGGIISLLFLLSFIVGYLLFSGLKFRILFYLITVPLLYWLSGGMAFFFLLFIIMHESLKSENRSASFLLILFVCTIYTISFPFIAKLFNEQYPLTKFWIGVNYFRYPVILPVPVGIISLTVIIIPFISKRISRIVVPQRTIKIILIETIVFVFGGLIYMYWAADFNREEIMAYDFNARMRRWDQIITMADKKAPMGPLSVTCLNLALAKKGMLSEKMFTYYQNGEGGLIPNFTKDFTIPMVAGEVYYHLGFINTSKRYAFEAMEALPDYQKSVRSIKRLAETYMIERDYKLAGKYLRLLQHTFYYRKWATMIIEMLKNEHSIVQHAEYGPLSLRSIKQDFLFSEGEKDMMLGMLLDEGRSNRMVYEYLMAYTLLRKDLQHFMEYLQLGRFVKYNKMPLSYQEAFLFAWSNANKDTELPLPINETIKKQMADFQVIYSKNPTPEALSAFSNTYWYYFYFNNIR